MTSKSSFFSSSSARLLFFNNVCLTINHQYLLTLLLLLLLLEKAKGLRKKERKKEKTHEDNEGPEKYFSSYFLLKEIDHFETKNQILGQDYLSRTTHLSWQQAEIYVRGGIIEPHSSLLPKLLIEAKFRTTDRGNQTRGAGRSTCQNLAKCC